MARAPNEKVNKALELYQRGYKLIEIAKELDIPEGTIRSWKNRYRWDDYNNATLQSDNSNVAKNRNNKKEPIAHEVMEVIENPELNDKQRLFCVVYAKCLNATKAYQRIYGCSYETAMISGSRLLRNVKVKEQIDILIAAECNKEFLKKSILQKYIDIAFADITDYLEFGQQEIEVMGPFGPVKDEDGTVITKVVNTVKFKESYEVDGTILSEVKQGKDGASIKLLDKMKAIDFLAKYSGLLDVPTKEKLQLEKKKVEQVQEKIDYEKNKSNQSDKPIEIVIKRKERD